MSGNMARTGMGRVVLHVLALVRDGHYRWHWKGIMRELGRVTV